MAKKKSGAKTNAARILDGLGVPYELKEYPVDPDDLSAVHVAEMVGMPVEQVFKTLVARGDKTGVLMACIPGDGELDLKEVLGLTGYVRGGCSPLGAKKAYPVYLDASAEKQSTISISAGKRGEQIVLAPADLIRAANAAVAKLNRHA